MGYWEMDDEGHSFVAGDEPDNQMIWGDQPADIVGRALAQIKVDFIRHLGRMPSQREIIAGLKFTTNVLDGLAVEPRDAPEATPEQIDVVRRYGYAAYGDDVETPVRQRKAWRKIRALLKELEKDDSVDEEAVPEELDERVHDASSRTDDVHDITEGTHVTESLEWLKRHAYIGALTATIPQGQVAPMLMFRPADMPFAPIQMACAGERLVYLPGPGIQIEPIPPCTCLAPDIEHCERCEQGL